jgi:glycosyltransferase involved in cell wall biosynthesis
MKILSVIESFSHGGAETVLVDLVLGLTEHTHRVVHFSRANDIPVHVPFVDSLAAAGVESVDAHWSCLADPASRRRVLEDFGADVVLFHWWGKDPWLPWISSTLDQPPDERPVFVCILHHAGIGPAPGHDRYVLVAPNQIPQVSHLSRDLILRIPNGVDLARFAPTDRPPRSRSVDGREMVVGRLSNLRPAKIPSDWVRTLARFDLPGTRFVIAGEGPMRAPLETDARTLAPGRFAFPGYVARGDVPDLLRTFDVFCYATAEAEECHPLGLLESLAAGVPIVAEAKGGIPFIVRHGKNGFLASSTPEIGDHLHRLRAEPALRARLAAGARRDARRFSLELQLARYRALLAELESERRAMPARQA